MNNRIFSLYILSAFIFSAGIAFSDQSSPSSNDKSSAEPTTNAQVQVPAVPEDTTAAHTSYLYDLKKLIDKSRENIKEVNEKIREQAILKRNQKREERAHEYYEKGMELTKEGRLDEARDYFEKAIRITEHPEMAGYIRESQRRLRKQEDALHAQERQQYNQIKQDENVRKEDVEAAYKEAVDLYKQKKYHPAKDAFEHVDEIAPDYRATDSYLKIIDQDIVIADRLAVKEQAVEIANQQKEAESARAREKQMWLAQIEEKEKERKEAIDKQAQEVYDQAVELYKNKKFAEAKKKFEEVSWVIPDYKSTMKYLARIDRDAQEEQQRVAREQQQALQEQRWEEEVEKKKQEALHQRELEAKQLQHQKDLQEQAQFLYTAAVSLFDHNNMDAALEKFNDIEKLIPDFKSTKLYIARIEQQKTGGQPHQQALPQQKSQDVQSQAQKLYDQALQLYQDHQWESAHAQFEAVEQTVPDFKHTRRYLKKIEKIIGNVTTPPLAPSAPVVVAAASTPVASSSAPSPAVALVPVVASQPVVSSMPPQVKVAVSLEDQQKQAQEIAALADRSAQLYRQIADIADDSATVQTKRKMAQVDDILNSLKNSKERLLRQMQAEQWKQQEEESKTKQEEHKVEAEKMYQEGLDYLRSHEYAKAKIKFLELENIIPDYKATRRYLGRIDEDLKKGNVEAVTNYEKDQADHLRKLQDKENAAEFLHAQQEQEKQRQIAQQEQDSLRSLAQKASDINDDIIRLSKQQDYEGMKVKFTELEGTVTALTTLKDEMAKEKDRQGREKELARETMRQRKEMLRGQQREDRQIHAYYSAQPLKEYRPQLSNQPNDADHYKRLEIMQEQNVLFSEGVDRYEHKKYTQAKLLFGELADQHDHRAEIWLKKVDRAITRELLKSQEAEEQERTAFIADQVKAQRELIIIQERERQRQKKLSEELERQTRLYEDDRLLQLRKEETMKSQERERERQEEKRLRLEKENEKQQQMFRFHKIETPVIKPPAEAAPQPVVQPAAVKETVAAVPVPVQPQVMSNEQKSILERKQRQEQRETERQARRKAAEDARQQRIEAREKEKERRKQLKAEREEVRQGLLKSQAETKAQKAQAQDEQASQEKKRREELMDQQGQQREEKIKQEEIVRDEDQRRKDAERQEREREAQLEVQRESIHKQLEDGVEAMYQDAMRLYRQGDYIAAADRFKDVQDIIPGYKHAEQYMDEAHLKSLAGPSSPPVAHQDNVSKALDLFDPNAK